MFPSMLDELDLFRDLKKCRHSWRTSELDLLDQFRFVQLLI